MVVQIKTIRMKTNFNELIPWLKCYCGTHFKDNSNDYITKWGFKHYTHLNYLTGYTLQNKLIKTIYNNNNDDNAFGQINILHLSKYLLYVFFIASD